MYLKVCVRHANVNAVTIQWYISRSVYTRRSNGSKPRCSPVSGDYLRKFTSYSSEQVYRKRPVLFRFLSFYRRRKTRRLWLLPVYCPWRFFSLCSRVSFLNLHLVFCRHRLSSQLDAPVFYWRRAIRTG